MFINAGTRRRARRAVISAGLELASLMSTMGLFGPARGRGAIFTLHRIRPQPTKAFQPNEVLEITPEFLEATIVTLRDEGYHFIRLEELPARLADESAPPFACFTIDDGYRDVADIAAEVFTRQQVPFTIFLVSGFIDRSRTMWWETLEAVISRTEQMTFDFGRGAEELVVANLKQKHQAFDRIADHINAGDEQAAVTQLDEEARRLGINPVRIVNDVAMDEAGVRALLANSLVSCGVHTVSHRAMARLPTPEAEAEIAAAAEGIESLTGSAPATFAYPYGDKRSVGLRERQILKRLGLPVAVTTRPGTVTPDMAADATALPRISLNGLYQKQRYVRALASGIPFLMTA